METEEAALSLASAAPQGGKTLAVCVYVFHLVLTAS